MKIRIKKNTKSGFTLLELMVAMAVTTVLVGILLGVVKMAVDSFRDSRERTRVSRLAKEVLDVLAKDFEGMVVQSNNSYEWAVAKNDDSIGDGPNTDSGIPNATRLVFFTAATDRYNGNVNTSEDGKGDVSTVSYRLTYKDPFTGATSASSGNFPVFSMYRHLVNPDETYESLLAEEDLLSAYSTFQSDDLDAGNFVAENIYEFTVTFLVEYEHSGSKKLQRVPLLARGSGEGFEEVIIRGDEIHADGSGKAFSSGRVVGVELNIVVLTDRGIAVASKSSIDAEELVRKYGYHFSRTVHLPTK